MFENIFIWIWEPISKDFILRLKQNHPASASETIFNNSKIYYHFFFIPVALEFKSTYSKKGLQNKKPMKSANLFQEREEFCTNIFFSKYS